MSKRHLSGSSDLLFNNEVHPDNIKALSAPGHFSKRIVHHFNNTVALITVAFQQAALALCHCFKTCVNYADGLFTLSTSAIKRKGNF